MMSMSVIHNRSISLLSVYSLPSCHVLLISLSIAEDTANLTCFPCLINSFAIPAAILVFPEPFVCDTRYNPIPLFSISEKLSRYRFTTLQARLIFSLLSGRRYISVRNVFSSSSLNISGIFANLSLLSAICLALHSHSRVNQSPSFTNGINPIP